MRLGRPLREAQRRRRTTTPPSTSARCWAKPALQGRDKLTLITDAPFISFGAWQQQLVAESSGKEGKGIVPIVDEALLDAAQYAMTV